MPLPVLATSISPWNGTEASCCYSHFPSGPPWQPGWHLKCPFAESLLFQRRGDLNVLRETWTGRALLPWQSPLPAPLSQSQVLLFQKSEIDPPPRSLLPPCHAAVSTALFCGLSLPLDWKLHRVGDFCSAQCLSGCVNEASCAATLSGSQGEETHVQNCSQRHKPLRTGSSCSGTSGPLESGGPAFRPLSHHSVDGCLSLPRGKMGLITHVLRVNLA